MKCNLPTGLPAYFYNDNGQRGVFNYLYSGDKNKRRCDIFFKLRKRHSKRLRLCLSRQLEPKIIQQ